MYHWRPTRHTAKSQLSGPLTAKGRPFDLQRLTAVSAGVETVAQTGHMVHQTATDEVKVAITKLAATAPKSQLREVFSRFQRDCRAATSDLHSTRAVLSPALRPGNRNLRLHIRFQRLRNLGMNTAATEPIPSYASRNRGQCYFTAFRDDRQKEIMVLTHRHDFFAVLETLRSTFRPPCRSSVSSSQLKTTSSL